jgi:arylsulfatase A-like enzyme
MASSVLAGIRIRVARRRVGAAHDDDVTTVSEVSDSVGSRVWTGLTEWATISIPATRRSVVTEATAHGVAMLRWRMKPAEPGESLFTGGDHSTGVIDRMRNSLIPLVKKTVNAITGGLRSGAGRSAEAVSRREEVCQAGVMPDRISRRSLAAALWSAGRRPNVVFVMPDQMRAQALAPAEEGGCRTPNLDRLARDGIVMGNTLANSPVCCPARAVLLTGRYTHSNGMTANDLRLRESSWTLAKRFREAGYRTGFTGKWHLDGGPRMPGFVPPGPRRQGFEWWAANECSHSHFDTQYFRDTPAPVPVRRFEPGAWTDLALEFLDESRRDGRPFFLCVWMGPPHDPYKAPEEFARLYDPGRLKMRPNWRAGDGNPGPEQIAHYNGMVSAVDEQVGRLTSALDQWGLGEDTILVFSSDHGDMLGSQGEILKRKPWEESIRVPGIVRWPGRIGAGRRETALWSHVDFAPTLLGLCGIEPRVRLQGADLSPVLLGKPGRGPDSAFFQIFGPFQGDRTPAGWRGVRTDRWMYARFRDKPWVLYDLEKDPYELENLAADPAARRVREQMEARLERWMRTTGDSWSSNWTYPVEDAGRLYKSSTYYSVDEYLRATGER